MNEDGVPSADRFEGRGERPEQTGSTIPPGEERLARMVEAIRERDRVAAFEAWRRWPWR